MPTECSADLFDFAPVAGRRVVASVDGGTITSDAGALLLGEADRAIGLVHGLRGTPTSPEPTHPVETPALAAPSTRHRPDTPIKLPSRSPR